MSADGITKRLIVILLCHENGIFTMKMMFCSGILGYTHIRKVKYVTEIDKYIYVKITEINWQLWILLRLLR